MITVGLPKDKPLILSFLLSFCIYTMYIYTFCCNFPSKKDLLPSLFFLYVCWGIACSFFVFTYIVVCTVLIYNGLLLLRNFKFRVT